MTSVGCTPVKPNERHIVIDALRGFALLGICMANFPEFSLYTFLDQEVVASMPTAVPDRIFRYLLSIFVDGKFYTLFSLLFGIGFSIIFHNLAQKGSNMMVFYNRMFILLAIGFLHLMFIWSGDILMLYALLGMFLPFYRNATNRQILLSAVFFLLLPVLVDAVTFSQGIRLSAPAVDAQWYHCNLYGITEDNFAYWLRDAQNYDKVLQFLIQGACVRMQEFIDGNRYFKVFGLFLIGFYIGRNRLYADLESRAALLKQVARLGFQIGLPGAMVYAWSSMNGHPFGDTTHSLLYVWGVYPLGFAYLAAFPLLYIKWKQAPVWQWLAATGRMALTNYIGQSVIGMFLFYGIGLGMGAKVGLIQTEGIVLLVYLTQTVCSFWWLRFFRFGPLEWIWRMATYQKRISLRK